MGGGFGGKEPSVGKNRQFISKATRTSTSTTTAKEV